MQTAARSIPVVIPAQAGIQPQEPPIIRHLGLSDYATTYAAMRRFTETRSASTRDELWVLEHPPVYTIACPGP